MAAAGPRATTTRLLNLGNPACRQWLTDHVCRLIQDNGIKIYRQDYNFAPLEHWRENEADGPPGDEREPARPGLPAVLGRPAGAQPRPVDRFVRQRRAPQRPGDHAPLRAAALHRLRLRQPPGEAGLPPHAVRVDPLLQGVHALLGPRRDGAIRPPRGQLLLPLRPGAHALRHARHPPGRLRLRSGAGR